MADVVSDDGELSDEQKRDNLVRLAFNNDASKLDRFVQLIKDAYANTFRALYPGNPGLTFPTWEPHVRLDSAFVPTGHLERVKSCEVITGPDAREASDHFPVLTEIEVRR